MTCLVVPFFLVDSHAHLQLDPLFSQIELALNNALTVSVHAIIINAVCPGVDWERVETICLGFSGAQSPLLIPSFGLHPWWIEEMLKATELEEPPSDSDEAIAALCTDIKQQLTHKLCTFSLAGVGECGLDKVIKKRVPLVTQEALLRCHLELAMEYERPASLHCVGAWGRMFDMLQSLDQEHESRRRLSPQEKSAGGIGMMQALSSSSSSSSSSSEGVHILERRQLRFVVVLHSCNKMPIDMLPRFQQLKSIPIYYSFNGKQLDDQVGKLLAVIPRDKLLIETDSPDQMPTAVTGTPTPTTTTSSSLAPPSTCATSSETTTASTVASPIPPSCTPATTSTNMTISTATSTSTLPSDPRPTVPSMKIEPLRVLCNQPANIVITCDRVSALLGESSSVIANATSHNAMLVFTGAC